MASAGEVGLMGCSQGDLSWLLALNPWLRLLPRENHRLFGGSCAEVLEEVIKKGLHAVMRGGLPWNDTGSVTSRREWLQEIPVAAENVNRH